MFSGEIYAALMFPVLFFFVFMGIPIAFSLLGTSFLFGLVLFGDKVGLQLYGGITQTASQFLLSAIPPFVFMGCMLESSGIAERLFRGMQIWLGRYPGGLALATLAMAAVIAASTGIVGAVEVVIGVMAIPVMLSYKYNKSLIAGTICAGGSLGTMIPPSLVVIIYASVANMSVGQLFAAVLIPGSVMVLLFFGYILIRCLMVPEDGPAVVSDHADYPLTQKLWITLTALVPAMLLIIAVLGAIMFGIATPTEASSVGALGAVVLAISYRRFNLQILYDTLKRTLIINCMIMMIVVGGSMFSGVFRIHGGNRLVIDLISALDLNATGIITILLLITFLAGFILDWVSIVLIFLPVFLPLLVAMNIDQIWFGVMMIVVIQTSYLTPPMAPSIFYLRSIAPVEMSYADMYKGVMPFILCQIIVLVFVALFPWLATSLPKLLFNGV